MEPYYYNHMDRERQAVYRAMHQGLLRLADSFQVPKIDGHALSDIFFELRLDHPEPVSYTHLDVYKRQDFHLMARCRGGHALLAGKDDL